METAERHNCDGSRPQGGQASDQASKRTPGRHRTLRSDTSLERHRQFGSFENRVTNKEHRRQPDKRPRRDISHTHSSGMSPERFIRGSNCFVEHIASQRDDNLVSFRSPSLTHNRSDKRDRPCTEPRLPLFGRFRFRCGLVPLLPRVYCCTREILRQPYLDRLTVSGPTAPPPRESPTRSDADLCAPCCPPDFGEGLGLAPMCRLTPTVVHAQIVRNDGGVRTAAWASAQGCPQSRPLGV